MAKDIPCQSSMMGATSKHDMHFTESGRDGHKNPFASRDMGPIKLRLKQGKRLWNRMIPNLL